MRTGSTGDQVLKLQQLLVEFGVDRVPSHAATGQFTELTDVAVRLIQEHVRSKFDPEMDVDGACGPATWGWIDYLVGSDPSQPPPAGGAPANPNRMWLERRRY